MVRKGPLLSHGEERKLLLNWFKEGKIWYGDEAVFIKGGAGGFEETSPKGVTMRYNQRSRSAACARTEKTGDLLHFIMSRSSRAVLKKISNKKKRKILKKEKKVKVRKIATGWQTARKAEGLGRSSRFGPEGVTADQGGGKEEGEEEGGEE